MALAKCKNEAGCMGMRNVTIGVTSSTFGIITTLGIDNVTHCDH